MGILPIMESVNVIKKHILPWNARPATLQAKYNIVTSHRFFHSGFDFH